MLTSCLSKPFQCHSVSFEDEIPSLLFNVIFVKSILSFSLLSSCQSISGCLPMPDVRIRACISCLFPSFSAAVPATYDVSRHFGVFIKGLFLGYSNTEYTHKGAVLGNGRFIFDANWRRVMLGARVVF